MATTKYKNAAKRNPMGAKIYEQPVEWAELLRQAVTEPGIISQAYSMFYGYSVGNQMLALWQLTRRGIDVGPLASYSKWQELGRQVRKGETAVIMMVPRVSKKTVEAEDGSESEERRVYFSFRPTAFAFAQTDPLEGKPDRPAELLNRIPDWDAERAVESLGVALAPFEDTNGNKQGYYQPSTRTVHVNPMGAHREKTLIHELAHSILHADGYQEADSRGTAEAEAECVSLIVGTVLGLGGADESRGYVQTWLARAGKTDLTEKSAHRILGAAQKILAAGQEARAEVEAVA